jgi:hypothetical protein
MKKPSSLQISIVIGGRITLECNRALPSGSSRAIVIVEPHDVSARTWIRRHSQRLSRLWPGVKVTEDPDMPPGSTVILDGPLPAVRSRSAGMEGLAALRTLCRILPLFLEP